VIVEVPDCPGDATVMEVGFADTLKSETVTVTGDEVEAA
jgi:hypothetical protein